MFDDAQAGEGGENGRQLQPRAPPCLSLLAALLSLHHHGGTQRGQGQESRVSHGRRNTALQEYCVRILHVAAGAVLTRGSSILPQPSSRMPALSARVVLPLFFGVKEMM